jgi:hypothetical protein
MSELLRNLCVLWMAVGLVAGVAHAEGVGSEADGANNDRRIFGVQTVLPMPSGMVALGGASLRRLAPGSRRWETLHTLPKDHLYRVAGDDSGRLLAVWENDPFIHLFSPEGKLVASFPKPKRTGQASSRYEVTVLEFLPNGRDALVYMSGKIQVTRGGSRSEGWITGAYRIALDGKSEAEQLFQLEHGYRLYASRFGAVFAMPRDPLNSCDHRHCDIASIVAYELTADGVRQKVLLDGKEVNMDRARLIRGSSDDRVAVRLNLFPRKVGLLSWRFGDAKASFQTMPWPEHEDLTEFFWTREGAFIELRNDEKFLEVWRHRPSDEEKLARLKVLRDVDTEVHAVGERTDGTLWLQWGDHLGLLSPGKPPRGYDLVSVLPRRAEWTGIISVKTPEHLWVGIDTDKGRHYVRVDFADLEKRSKVWR